MGDSSVHTLGLISSFGSKSPTIINDNTPNLQDDDLESSLSTGPDRKLSIENITIAYDSTGSISTAKNLVVFSPKRETGEELLFAKISPQEWKYVGIIEVIDTVEFIVRGDERDDFGYVRLSKAELGEFVNCTGSCKGFKREFAAQTGSLKLKLTCDISIIQTGENLTGKGRNRASKNSRDILARNTETLRALDLEGFYDDPSTVVEPGLFNMCGDQFLDRFRETRNRADIETCVLAFDLALQLTPVDDPTFMDFLNDTAVSVLDRYESTRNLSDVDKAISRFEITANALPDGHEYKTTRLNYLGDAYEWRFDHTGDLYDISRSISCREKAVLFENRTELPGILSNLGNSYQRRFKHTGNLTDISRAIAYKQKAVHLTPDDDHANMAARQSNLGSSHRFRFERTRDLTDIDEAISCAQKAVHLTPNRDEWRSARLSNLGIAHLSRFLQTGDPADRSQAILYAQEAVDLTPEGNPTLPDRLNNLAISYSANPGSDRTGYLASISESIICLEKAINLIPKDQDAKSATLSFNTGMSYQDRFEYTKDIADLGRAISCLQKAVDLTPDGHAEMPARLSAVAHCFRIRFEHTGDLGDIQAGVSNYSLAATSPGPPSIKLDCAKKWAQLCEKFDPPQLVDAYSTAISLASQVAGLEQTIKRRQLNLPGMSELPTSAAAAACQLEKPELALEWLEQGRCLVWSQLNDLRSPLDDLRASHPTIADDLWKVATALEYAGSRREADASDDMLQKMSLQDEVTTHVKLAQRWDELLAKVRDIPGYGDFLRPPSHSTLLQNTPRSGPVIVINVHKSRCDALALVAGAERPLHIPLPLFSRAKADRLLDSLKDELDDSGYRNVGEEKPNARGMRYESNGSCVKEILRQLWISVVKPILDGLGYSKPPPDLPRIWWCVTGPLAFLPIHAAGIYDGSTTEVASTLSDFGISSYIPNVRALIERTKKNPQDYVHMKPGLFMIGDPQARNLSFLPGTITEVRAIERRLEAYKFRILRLEKNAATVNQAMANMETHSCIHFACHASQNTREPLKSGFALHDGRLELSSIIQKKLEVADLAFLSACQTSTGDEKLSEEAVHLAAGMLAAGYRGVVATMWSIQDRYGPQVAEDFYANLMEGSEELSGEDAARALHYATQKLRKTLGDSDSTLLAWVPYIHFGL